MRKLLPLLYVLSACGDDGGMAAVDAQPADAITLSILDAYGAAWAEADAAARGRLLEYSTVETITVSDPNGTVASRSELDAQMAQFQSDVPGGSVPVIGNIREAHDRVWLQWEVRNANGAGMGRGVDLMLRDGDQRIARVHSFFGIPTPPTGTNTPVQQALIDAFNQSDNTMRATLLATAMADNVVVAIEDQTSTFSGRVAFSAVIANQLTASPGRTYSVTTGYSSIPNAFHVAWKTVASDGTTMIESGVMMAVLATDGRIEEAVFWTGTLP